MKTVLNILSNIGIGALLIVFLCGMVLGLGFLLQYFAWVFFIVWILIVLWILGYLVHQAYNAFQTTSSKNENAWLGEVHKNK